MYSLAVKETTEGGNGQLVKSDLPESTANLSAQGQAWPPWPLMLVYSPPMQELVQTPLSRSDTIYSFNYSYIANSIVVVMELVVVT